MKTKDYDSWDKSRLIEELKRLSARKKYGLVWEEKPEDVVERCKAELPILEEVEGRALEVDSTLPTNFIIEGDNYHALSVLNYTHAGKIDVIYIDPPYNTGATDWRYNNDYVDANDAYRHSKFITFMSHRLNLAKRLLANDGFLICAIDANELYTLGLLLDEIFGEQNRLGLVTVLHNPKGRNFTRYFSANSEYMLVYCKDVNIARFNQVAIDEEVRKTFNLVDSDGRRYRLEPLMRSRTETLRENKPAFWYPIYVSKTLDKISLEERSGYTAVYPIADNGKEATWINLPETFDEKNKQGLFIAQKEQGKVRIYRKYYEQQIYKNVWTDKKYQSEFNGTNLLKKVLGKNIFDYPKSLYLVEDILKITSKKSSVILDFFAGSGTTGHAVMTLNAQDGGNRRFILCTNNENGIAEEVTYPRIKNVIQGYADVEGIPANVRYFKTAFVPKSDVSDDTRRSLIAKSTEMLCVKESTFKKLYDNKKFKIYRDAEHATAILFDLDALNEFKEKIEDVSIPTNIYVFSLTSDTFSEDFRDLEVKHRLRPIPEGILEVYRKIFA